MTENKALGLTADKNEVVDFPRLPLATFFIRRSLDDIGRMMRK